MGSEQTSHITVAYQDAPNAHVTKVYAIDTKTFRKLHRTKDWLGRARDQPTGEALGVWLRKHGCKLDSSDGPACVTRYLSGTTVETYFSHGLEHRADGPSTVIRRPDGSRHEAYYTHGEFCRAVECSPNGTIRPLSLGGALPPYLHL
jgi:hypothetical protein